MVGPADARAAAADGGGGGARCLSSGPGGDRWSPAHAGSNSGRTVQCTSVGFPSVRQRAECGGRGRWHRRRPAVGGPAARRVVSAVYVCTCGVWGTSTSMSGLRQSDGDDGRSHPALSVVLSSG